MNPWVTSPPPSGAVRAVTSARTKLLVSLGGAIAGGAAAALAGAGRAAPLIGWDILAAVIYCGWVWSTVWKLGPVDGRATPAGRNPAGTWPTWCCSARRSPA